MDVSSFLGHCFYCSEATRLSCLFLALAALLAAARSPKSLNGVGIECLPIPLDLLAIETSLMACSARWSAMWLPGHLVRRSATSHRCCAHLSGRMLFILSRVETNVQHPDFRPESEAFVSQLGPQREQLQRRKSRALWANPSLASAVRKYTRWFEASAQLHVLRLWWQTKVFDSCRASLMRAGLCLSAPHSIYSMLL